MYVLGVEFDEFFVSFLVYLSVIDSGCCLGMEVRASTGNTRRYTNVLEGVVQGFLMLPKKGRGSQESIGCKLPLHDPASRSAPALNGGAQRHTALTMVRQPQGLLAHH